MIMDILVELHIFKVTLFIILLLKSTAKESSSSEKILLRSFRLSVLWVDSCTKIDALLKVSEKFFNESKMPALDSNTKRCIQKFVL